MKTPIQTAKTLAFALSLSIAANDASASGPVAVSENDRYLVRESGEPFFWLGDTAWELFHRLNFAESDRYLRNRAAKGFTVIQAVLLAELDGLRTPNANGDLPLIDMDPSRPNEAYFENVDRVVQRANELGLTIALLPTWGDKFNLKWGVGPTVFTQENARTYGKWVGERYANSQVLWILGGDRPPEEVEHFAIIDAMAEGIREAVGDSQLITYHPFGGASSSKWWHDRDWLDFNFFQSGHSHRDERNFEVTLRDRALQPTKPVLDGEPCYEDHPVGWKPEELGWFNDFDVRRAAWWSMLSGAAGHTYGHHAVWQMWQPGRDPISFVRTPWQQALDYPGAFQMGALRQTLELLPWHRLEPRADLLVSEALEPAATVALAAVESTRNDDIEAIVAYSPFGYSFDIDLSSLSSERRYAYWVDPRSGNAIPLPTPEKKITRFDPPQSPERGNDWTLVVASSRIEFPSAQFSYQLGDPLATLSPNHPRLLASQAEWDELERKLEADPKLEVLAESVVEEANRLLETPPVERILNGRRMLGVSREALRRTLFLLSAYRISGDTRYIKRLEMELLAVAAFSDWNPKHFLDVAEMTTAVAIGYDECYDRFSSETLGTLRKAIVELGLRPAMDLDSPHLWWYEVNHNWNQVCWGGAIMGALAIADEEPELAQSVLRRARNYVSYGMTPYEPDGLYPEGPGYWAYGTTYQVIMIEALRNALGDTWELPRHPGFLPGAEALSQVTGPTGMPYNFSDGGESLSFAPALLWFAGESDQPEMLAAHRKNRDAWLDDSETLSSNRFSPLALLWWESIPESNESDLPLAIHFRGEQPVAVLRSSWSDSKATYLGTKGGSASLNHAHMDAGSFVLEADSVRWARDLGAQAYHTLEAKGIDLWNRDQNSERWSVFRLNNHSHNTLVIDNQLQQVDGHATIEAFQSGAEPFALLDLSSVYSGQADSVRRGFRLDSNGRILVQDELSGLEPTADIRWAMVTGAEIAIESNGKRATLSQDGESLSVELLEPADARFQKRSAEPPPDDFNASNPGFSMLTLNTEAPSNGNVRIRVLMTPGSIGSELSAPRPSTLENWK